MTDMQAKKTLPATFEQEFPPRDETTRFVTRCPKCKARHAIDIPVPYASTFYVLSVNGFQGPENVKYVRCACGRVLNSWTQIRGKLGAKKCDARCTGAIGPSCECQCGGKNHGADNL